MSTYGARPSPLKKWLLHAPAYVYKVHLGFVFGKRFLMIEHRGRTSGTRYSTVLEVAGHNEERGEYISTAGRGPTSDWYLNLRANGVEALWMGSRRHRATVRFLDARESAEVFAVYETKYPRTAKKLLDTMGVNYDGSDAGRVEMMEKIPMVAFRPDD